MAHPRRIKRRLCGEALFVQRLQSPQIAIRQCAFGAGLAHPRTAGGDIGQRRLFLRLPHGLAALIEEGRRRRDDPGDDRLAPRHPIAGFERDPQQPATQGRGDGEHIMHPRLALVINRHSHRPARHRGGIHQQHGLAQREKYRTRNHRDHQDQDRILSGAPLAACRRRHLQSLVFNTATRSS